MADTRTLPLSDGNILMLAIADVGGETAWNALSTNQKNEHLQKFTRVFQVSAAQGMVTVATEGQNWT